MLNSPPGDADELDTCKPLDAQSTDAWVAVFLRLEPQILMHKAEVALATPSLNKYVLHTEDVLHLGTYE